VPDVLEQLRTALGDRYEVERQVGEGGMATVFLARDVRHGRQVAIKTLRAELAASIGADRFLREIQLAANLQHPNILALYDSGEANGILFYVMPFIEGESLRGRLNREQQLPLNDAVRITREAAEALAYAHEHGVIHRDIKPENILLQNGHALVADFGIARALDAAGERLTQTGMAVGTPHYMSPEQALGSDHTDGRSDVYSLGCVLYELIIGQPPFDGPNAMAILARHSMEQVPSLRIVRQSVPEEVEETVLQALEKTPADRFQTMGEFAETLADLEATVATRRTSSRAMPARTTGTTPRRTTGVTQRRSGAIAPSRLAALLENRLVRFGVPAVILLVAAAVAAWRLWLHPGGADATARGVDPNRIAVLYFEQGPGGSDSLGYLADGLTDALIHELSGVSQLQVISSNGVRPYKKGNANLHDIARQLRVGTLVHGGVAQSGARLRVNVSMVDAATGVEIGSKTVERPRGEIFQLQDDLAKEVSIFLRQQIGREVNVRASRVGTDDAGAWELLQKAQKEAGAVEPLLSTGDTAAIGRQFARADSLLVKAEALDRKWVTPISQRGWLAYRRARVAGSFDKEYYDHWTQRGLAHAERALALRPNDPDALELRGTHRYLRWLLNLNPDQAEGARLLADAEKDLRAAVGANAVQASAWTTLSHLLINKLEVAEAKLAALKAYEADPYLTNANLTVWRLFSTSLDLEDVVEARHWCAEGGRRFPEDPRFAECQIWLFAAKGQTPDILKAWALLEDYVRLSPPNLREFRRLRGQMLVAMALARAGLKDSARAIAVRSRADATVDPPRELVNFEAIVQTMLGDKDEAFRLLTTYLATNPQQRSAMARDESWWLRDLHGDPRWTALVGAPR